MKSSFWDWRSHFLPRLRWRPCLKLPPHRGAVCQCSRWTRTRPKMPANMKIGDASSIAIDANDNAWVLSRPRTLKGDDQKKAAPPIMIFDPAGNFIRGWGGDGPGL